MTTLAYILGGLLALAVVVIAGVVLQCRAHLRLDELEIAMLREKILKLEQHPGVKARPRAVVTKHLHAVVGPGTVGADLAKEAAQHAAARERHEK